LGSYSRPTVYAYVLNFDSIGLFCRRLLAKPPPIFADFGTSTFSGVANWQQSAKVEHGCTTTSLPLSNGIKIVYIFHRLRGEIERRISDVQKHYGHTNRQTD